MLRWFRRIDSGLRLFGIDFTRFVNSFRGLPSFVADYRKFRKLSSGSWAAQFPYGKMYPCLSDRFEPSGTAGGHYFLQDLVVAQRVFQNRPAKHCDIASRVDGFVAHVASFREIEVFDIRPLHSQIPNIRFQQLDLMIPDPKYHNYCDSLSSLHAIEHFGLGRYGDPIDPEGHVKAIRNCHRLLTPGGRFYLSTPLGPQRVEFNGQRVFSLKYLIQILNPYFTIEQLWYVHDDGTLNGPVSDWNDLVNTNAHCYYGCVILEMKKRESGEVAT